MKSRHNQERREMVHTFRNPEWPNSIKDLSIIAGFIKPPRGNAKIVLSRRKPGQNYPAPIHFVLYLRVEVSRTEFMSRKKKNARLTQYFTKKNTCHLLCHWIHSCLSCRCFFFCCCCFSSARIAPADISKIANLLTLMLMLVTTCISTGSNERRK